MSTNRSDLLSVTRTLLRWGFYIAAGLAVLMACILVALFVKEGMDLNINTRAASTPEQKLLVARVSVAAALACCLLAMPLLRRVLAIVDSARNGDPFVPENAERLRQVGWLLLASNALIGIAVGFAVRGIKFPPISFSAILTVLLIFVLAQIFEVGARMRGELQETV